MSNDLPPPVSPAPAPSKKSNTLVIVLCVVFGLLLLIIGSCVGTCVYVGKKAKDYAKESEKNPKVSTLALAAAIYPGVEVVSKDLDAGTLVLKNKKTGETVKLDANDFSEDRIMELLEKIAQGKGVDVALKPDATKSDSAESVAAEPVSEAQAAAQAAILKTFPASFPVYSSGGVQNVEVSQNVSSGVSTAEHAFLTSDAPDQVANFYEKKLKAAGYTLEDSESGSDSNGAKLGRVFQKGTSDTFHVTIRIEDGKTRVEASQVIATP